jgi:hypothetical protein
MIAEDEFTNYLRATAASCLHAAKLAAALLKHGCWFRKRASSDDYETTKQWRKLNRPRMKQCYYNSQLFCSEHDSARYFEGYVATRDLPFLHAWVVMPDGFVVDFTLEALERSNKRRSGGTTGSTEALYFGVEVPQQSIREAMMSGWIEPLAPRLFS